jgi:hypothetical protein
MSLPQRRYSDWKAPTGDGELFIWPEPQELLAQTRGNAAALVNCHVPVTGQPLADWRTEMRRLLGHPDNEQPLLVSGHQTELFHAGVWVKNALISAAAKALGGASIYLAVDTDHPKHLQLRWPGTSIPLTDDPALGTAAWAGLLAPPTRAHRAAIDAALAAAQRNWSFTPLLGDFLAKLWQSAPIDPPAGQHTAGQLMTALVDAQQQIDHSLGLDNRAALASPLWKAAPYLAYAHHLLADAPRVAAAYNGVLHEYRRQTNKRSTTRPMPDLHLAPGRIEVPFWLDDLATGQRQRACVRADGQNWALRVKDNQFLLDARRGPDAAQALGAFLAAHGARLSPRALTLTLFARLLICDQFVHGIGGARYDQITDGLIVKLFGIEPPAFAVATATLFFPEALGRMRVCLPCLLREGHRLRHGALGPAKRELVAQIAAQPRGSREKQQLFTQLQIMLKKAAADLPAIHSFDRRLAQARRQSAQENDLFNRELFYLIQSRQRLGDLAQRVGAAFGADLG